MNGLRLDRRADAMRGGTQSVIGPGNADGSKLYHRLVGTSMGTRMPPSGPLGADDIATLKAWIDQGADWPDELAGIADAPPVDPTPSVWRDSCAVAIARELMACCGEIRARPARGRAADRRR